VTRICFELHPVNLVYNVPTLLKMREAVGDAIGANFDPSHLMWQGMDIPACVRAIGPAIFHVHVKDVMMHSHNQALVGVLDNRPDATFRDRPWNFCTRVGHDALVASSSWHCRTLGTMTWPVSRTRTVSAQHRQRRADGAFLRGRTTSGAGVCADRVNRCGNVGVNAHPGGTGEQGMTTSPPRPTPERLQQRLRSWLATANLYTDWQDLLSREDVEAVIVATPQRFRPEIVMAAMAGKRPGGEAA
jgi:hypothetical protein